MGRRAVGTWCAAGIAFLGVAGAAATDRCEQGVIAPLLLVAALWACALLTTSTPGSGEERLDGAREHLSRAFMEMSSEAAFILDPGHTILALNGAAANLLGVEDEHAAVASPLTDHLPPGLLSPHIDGVLATGGSNRFEVDWLGRTLEFTVSPVADCADTPTCVLLLARDVRERIAAERALEDYRLIVDAAAEAMAVVGRDYTYRIVNAAYCDMLGRPSEQIIGRHARDVLGGEVWERISDQVETCLSGEPIRRVEWFDDAEGNRIYLEASYAPYRTGDDAVAGVVSVLRDVTTERRMQAALREKEANLAHASRLARLGSWVWHAQTGTTSYSDEQYRILGAEAGETQLDDARLRALVHPDDLAHVAAAVRGALSDGIPYDIEFRFYTVGGELRYAHGAAEVIRSADGTVEAVHGSMQDITERKLTELERERLIAELREALAEIKELRGLIPICAWCKKIRDDQGYWQQLEEYLLARSDVAFTHCICPECLAQAQAEEGVGSPSTSE